MRIIVDLDFDSIPEDNCKVIENIAQSLLHSINHSDAGIAPEDTFVKSFTVATDNGRAVSVDVLKGIIKTL